MNTVESFFYIDDGFDGHSGRNRARSSLEHHANASDLNAHLHGATPVPPRISGRPPRLSLQSSRTTISTNIDLHSPFVMNSALSKPIHVNCAMSTNNDFVLT
jgi:hypothetical protein